MINKQSIRFYEENAQSYFDRTVKMDLSFAYQLFLRYLSSSGKILDVGSGSGRDTKYFLELGFQVVSVDASAEMARLSTQYTGQQTIHCNLDDLSFEDEFDGIWCAGVLVHFDQEHVVVALHKIVQFLKPGGIAYFSFKYGETAEFVNGRFFLDQNENSLTALLAKINHLQILEMVVRPDEQGKNIWLNCIIKKS